MESDAASILEAGDVPEAEDVAEDGCDDDGSEVEDVAEDVAQSTAGARLRAHLFGFDDGDRDDAFADNNGEGGHRSWQCADRWRNMLNARHDTRSL